MKNIATSLAAFFAFSAIAAAQEDQDRLQQQPPPVTQVQVERHAQQASVIRDTNTAVPSKEQQKKDMQENRQDAATAGKGTATANTNKKASTRPGKQ